MIFHIASYRQPPVLVALFDHNGADQTVAHAGSGKEPHDAHPAAMALCLTATSKRRSAIWPSNLKPWGAQVDQASIVGLMVAQDGRYLPADSPHLDISTAIATAPVNHLKWDVSVTLPELAVHESNTCGPDCRAHYTRLETAVNSASTCLHRLCHPALDRTAETASARSVRSVQSWPAHG